MDTLPPADRPPLRLRAAIARWLACVALCWAGPTFAGLVGLPMAVVGGLLGVAYLAAGVYLNREVLRRLVAWHPLHDTLANVVKAKLLTCLLWPVAYPVLFFHLTVDRAL